MTSDTSHVRLLVSSDKMNQRMLKLINKLERDFYISKHRLISQRENQIMDYTIVSDNKLSSVALHQNHAIIFIEMLE